ncbi:MAG: EAL domain-containing protein [Phycisphaerales bacterium]|nr:EAL domain-containing protein [Phycisphaerales bacterium]
MSQDKDQDSRHLKLVNHLKLTEDLWQKLYYVKWNIKSFGMLARLAQDIVQDARAVGGERLINLAAQLEHHIKLCVATNTPPREAERQRLVALLDALRHQLEIDNSTSVMEEARTRPLSASQLEILVITPNEQPHLLAKLASSAYRARTINKLVEAEQRLRERVPSAIILDVDFPEGPDAVIQLIMKLRSEIQLQAPILFLAERNDITMRLDAARAGGVAYFNKPYDSDEVIGVLREQLLPQTAQGYHRVLIVHDQPFEAWEMAGILEERGITPHVVIQPLQILQEIHRFRPDLLIIDLDSKEVSGSELARVIAQHQEFDILPMILLCSPADMAHYLTELDVPGASLLAKPVPNDYLHWEVKQRLRRARATRIKMSSLSDNDPISGLFNRRRFMILLERAVETLGLRVQSLALVFIRMDSLQSIHDSAGVVTADAVVTQVANRLRHLLNHEQLATRFSDSAFTVLIPNLLGESLLNLVRHIHKTLEAGFYKVGDHALLLRASIGVATATGHGQDYLSLIQHADSACSLARETQGERIQVQQSTAVVKQDQEESLRLQMLRQAEEIIENERLWLLFQPIASIRGDVNERYEVLLRMRDGKGQEVVPGSIFGVVSHHQVGQALDRWIIERALEMLRQRQQTTTLFIKVLPVTLQERTFSSWLRTRLEQTGVEAQCLVFSVAEPTVEGGLRDMFNFLGGIKLLGCGFCLDRFGRGSNSLGLLKNLGADYVKLDMYFVNNLAKSAEKQGQLRELVQELEVLGAAIIVGGVEDVKTMPILWSLGIDLIQGFFLQRPHREMSYDFSGLEF